MTTYTFPLSSTAWRVSRFEMRVRVNQVSFTSPLSGTTQVLESPGERWQVRLDLTPASSDTDIAAREALLDRLRGQANLLALPHLKRLQPLGTLRGSTAASVVNGSAAAVTVVNGSAAAVTVLTGEPVLLQAVAALANTASINTLPGRTVLAGDMLSLGGQLVRVLADATADGSGVLSIEFAPRARAAIAQFAAVGWDRPTANFMLASADGVPTVYAPGYAEGASIDLIESF